MSSVACRVEYSLLDNLLSDAISLVLLKDHVQFRQLRTLFVSKDLGCWGDKL